MSIVGKGTAGASGTRPTSGYKLELSCLFIVFFLFLHRLSTNTNNPYEAIILLNNIIIYLITFGIKIYHKLPKFITYITYSFFSLSFTRVVD
jgi:purine-cytosine permease-like protein